MRRGRFTEDQIIGVLREHEASVKTADFIFGVSQQDSAQLAVLAIDFSIAPALDGAQQDVLEMTKEV